MLEAHIEQLGGCVYCEPKRGSCPRVEFVALGLLLHLEFSEADGFLDEGGPNSCHLLECEMVQCVSAIFVLGDVQNLFHSHLIYV